MTIQLNRNNKMLTVAVKGRLDTLTSPELEEQLEPAFEDTEKMVFDLAELEYISSAGLRVLLAAVKEMNAQGGELTLTKVRPEVMEVFEVTGFVDILTIE